MANEILKDEQLDRVAGGTYSTNISDDDDRVRTILFLKGGSAPYECKPAALDAPYECEPAALDLPVPNYKVDLSVPNYKDGKFIC